MVASRRPRGQLIGRSAFLRFCGTARNLAPHDGAVRAGDIGVCARRYGEAVRRRFYLDHEPDPGLDLSRAHRIRRSRRRGLRPGRARQPRFRAARPPADARGDQELGLHPRADAQQRHQLLHPSRPPDGLRLRAGQEAGAPAGHPRRHGGHRELGRHGPPAPAGRGRRDRRRGHRHRGAQEASPVRGAVGEDPRGRRLPGRRRTRRQTRGPRRQGSPRPEELHLSRDARRAVEQARVAGPRPGAHRDRSRGLGDRHHPDGGQQGRDPLHGRRRAPRRHPCRVLRQPGGRPRAVRGAPAGLGGAAGRHPAARRDRRDLPRAAAQTRLQRAQAEVLRGGAHLPQGAGGQVLRLGDRHAFALRSAGAQVRRAPRVRLAPGRSADLPGEPVRPAAQELGRRAGPLPDHARHGEGPGHRRPDRSRTVHPRRPAVHAAAPRALPGRRRSHRALPVRPGRLQHRLRARRRCPAAVQGGRQGPHPLARGGGLSPEAVRPALRVKDAVRLLPRHRARRLRAAHRRAVRRIRAARPAGTTCGTSTSGTPDTRSSSRWRGQASARPFRGARAPRAALHWSRHAARLRHPGTRVRRRRCRVRRLHGGRAARLPRGGRAGRLDRARRRARAGLDEQRPRRGPPPAGARHPPGGPGRCAPATRPRSTRPGEASTRTSPTSAPCPLRATS